MGSTGNKKEGATNPPVAYKPEPPKTKINKYGFEVEDAEYPIVEFTDLAWKDTADSIKKYPYWFEDQDLQDMVEEKIYQVAEDPKYEEAVSMYERLENEDVTSDEYWLGYHIIAGWLGIQQPRYHVLDSTGYTISENYGSVEGAEAWANEHEDATHIWDKWTHKYRKIGGKNWKK